MTLLSLRNFIIILLIWAMALALLTLGKDWYLKKYTVRPPQKTPTEVIAQQPLDFFDLESLPDEEIAAYRRELFGEEIFSVPLAQDLKVYQCPQSDCAILGLFEAGTVLTFNILEIDPEADWLPVKWPDTSAGPENAYISLRELEIAAQELSEAPDTVLDITELETTQIKPADPRPLNPQAIVGIACEFENLDGEKKFTRGSGAFISPEGHILSARSVVDLDFLNLGFEGYKIKGCLVGQLPSNQPLPSIEAIKKINAFTRIPFLAYTAEVVYIPTGSNVSDYEDSWLDFAILHVTGLNPDVKFFGINKMPSEFPVAPFLISDLPKMNEQVLNFAFPSGTTVGHGADIRTMFLQGLISKITNYWTGDNRFEDDLFLMQNHMITEDTAGGRFGSPIFWKGYVIAVHTVKERETMQIYNVSAKAVLENLFDNDINIPIEVY